jgi:hypothetical protein
MLPTKLAKESEMVLDDGTFVLVCGAGFKPVMLLA